MTDIDKIVAELNKRVGEQVWYHGGWGVDEPVLATFGGAEFDDWKQDVVVDVTVCANGHTHWGYIYQIEFVLDKPTPTVL